MAIHGDSFTDVDGTVLTAHTPDSPTAFVWSHPVGFGSIGLEATPVIESNAAVVAPGMQEANAICPLVDGAPVSISVTYEVINAAEDGGIALYLLASPTSAMTGYLIALANNGGSVSYGLYVGDFFDAFGYSLLQTGLMAAPAAGEHTLELSVNTANGAIAVLHDGVPLTSDTDTTYPALVGSAFGLQEYGASMYARILSFGDPDGEVPPVGDGGSAADDLSADEITANVLRSRLDRRVTESSTGVSVAFAGGNTTWTLPYSVPTDDSEGVLQVVRVGLTGVTLPLTTTRPAATQIRTTGDKRGMAVVIGIQYTFLYRFSTIFPRSARSTTLNVADTRGRLQLLRAVLQYRDSKAFDVNVTPPDRTARVYETLLDSYEDGEFRFPILSRNLGLDLTITNDSPFGCAITGLHWEGHYYSRSRSL